MKKYAFIIAALSACLTVSCNKELSNDETVTPQVTMKTVTITATIDDEIDESTKTSYSNTGVFSWTAGDQISVLGDDGNTYTFTANSTGVTSTFTGTMPDGVGLGARAHFPADSGHDIAGYKYCIPSSKDISAHVSADIPMVGVKDDTKYNFAHCCGATQLTIDNIPSKFVKVQITVSHPSLKLSGTFSIFTSGSYYKWNANTAANDAEKTYVRTVAVSDNKASIYIPYGSGDEWWGTNTVSVIGYDSADNPTTLLSDKAMKSIGAVARAHIKPLKPLGLDRLAFIDWSAGGIQTFAGNGTDNNYGERIIQWKVDYDSYYLYFYYTLTKSKIKYDSESGSYASSQSRIYIGLDLNNDPATGSDASFAGLPADSGWEATVEVRPWSGTTEGSPEIVSGTNSSSYIDRPVGTTLGAKVAQIGSFDASYAYLGISIPRSALGAISSTINVQHEMQWGYYTSKESVSITDQLYCLLNAAVQSLLFTEQTITIE